MITLKQNTEAKLVNYVSVYGGNYDKMINDILLFRKTQLQKSIKVINTDLIYFEKKHGMKSDIFYELFETGKLGDEETDYYQWSGEYEALVDYKKELKYLL